MKRLSFVVVTVLLGACHSWVPLETDVSPHGLKVLVSLTDQGTADFAPLLGSGIGEVEGIVTASTDSTLGLSVTLVRQRNGVEASWRGETVVLPSRSIASVREQRLSRSRTTMVAAASATGLAVITAVFGDRLLGGGWLVGSGGGRPR
jgi:hypothetical protein